MIWDFTCRNCGKTLLVDDAKNQSRECCGNTVVVRNGALKADAPNGGFAMGGPIQRIREK